MGAENFSYLFLHYAGKTLFPPLRNSLFHLPRKEKKALILPFSFVLVSVGYEGEEESQRGGTTNHHTGRGKLGATKVSIFSLSRQCVCLIRKYHCASLSTPALALRY